MWQVDKGGGSSPVPGEISRLTTPPQRAVSARLEPPPGAAKGNGGGRAAAAEAEAAGPVRAKDSRLPWCWALKRRARFTCAAPFACARQAACLPAAEAGAALREAAGGGACRSPDPARALQQVRPRLHRHASAQGRFRSHPAAPTDPAAGKRGFPGKRALPVRRR